MILHAVILGAAEYRVKRHPHPSLSPDRILHLAPDDPIL